MPSKVATAHKHKHPFLLWCSERPSSARKVQVRVGVSAFTEGLPGIAAIRHRVQHRTSGFMRYRSTAGSSSCIRGHRAQASTAAVLRDLVATVNVNYRAIHVARGHSLHIGCLLARDRARGRSRRVAGGWSAASYVRTASCAS